MADANSLKKEGDIAEVGNWKKENDRVEININAAAPNDIELKMEKGSNKTNLKIVVSKQKEENTPAAGKPDQPQKGHVNNEVEKSTAREGRQVNNSINQKEGSNNGKGNKNSENVLGNVRNMLKDYKGIIITAVIAISLGFLLRRKFKLV